MPFIQIHTHTCAQTHTDTHIRMHTPEIKLTKEIKELYNKNFKVLNKNLRNRERCSTRTPWINIVKIATLLEGIHGFNAIPMKITVILYEYIFYTDLSKPMDHQTFLNKKNTGGGMTIYDFPILESQPYREHDTGSTLGSWIDGYKFHTTTATWFLKRWQKYTLEKRQHFQHAVLGNLDFNMQQNETKSYLSPYMKLSSKWSKDLKIRPDIVKVHVVKVGISLQVHVRTFWARLQCTGNKPQ